MNLAEELTGKLRSEGLLGVNWMKREETSQVEGLRTQKAS